MLAYVFWHSAAEATEEYLNRLHAFHQSLSETPPAGMRASYTWQVGTVPWLDGLHGFEDWYVLEDVSYLDVLAEAAVSYQLRPVHDAVAHLSTHGIAGLYKPARGTQAQVEGPVATWFSKPAGESYDELYAHLDELDPSIADRLWQRYLTLGPAPEFCAVGDDVVDLPGDYATCVVRRRQ